MIPLPNGKSAGTKSDPQAQRWESKWASVNFASHGADANLQTLVWA